MHKSLLAAGLAALLMSSAASAQTLNVATAGDQNMVDYIKDYLGPLFEKSHPGVKVVAVGTGPGDGGSQKIFEKLDAQKKAGANADFDVVVIHQKAAGTMVKDELLKKYRDSLPTGKLVTRDTATNSLGTDVSGYVMPMFHSQTAIAYNPDLIKNPPNNYAELRDWVKKNPKQFGYNGIKGGMSGVAFVTGWISAFGGDAAKLEKGPYDAATKATWDKAMADLKEFNQNVVITPGNAGTLDMLNRGEIAMGPVWVDMFYTWKADGKLPPNMRLKLVSPGMPGQPMYYAIPSRTAQDKLAAEFIALATSPDVQAEGIVKRFNWYPGIDAKNLEGKLDQAAWNQLFADIPPDTLAANGKPFPIGPYFNDILETYERKVAN
ncbi:extracellular solute-binding protein [Microvirga sp. 3-52]|jgi:putative spermidine/putrescine transport system substrate-binding protein|uniref:ABC transporter substrate-binding protein n=1 Tax=Microvirga sp. 3-52 TaxID=2792425 RepID=UPI001AD1D297|nr:extracellular solute-binding protein [Microvirga sp. 3-52]MBO1903840.1 extracellular solute-binding protein [Microvirga sp. 3-52]MBS7451260.1 extracellular solute-binding protein [Microvirga sp. 3-52]